MIFLDNTFFFTNPLLEIASNSYLFTYFFTSTFVSCVDERSFNLFFSHF